MLNLSSTVGTQAAFASAGFSEYSGNAFLRDGLQFIPDTHGSHNCIGTAVELRETDATRPHLLDQWADATYAFWSCGHTPVAVSLWRGRAVPPTASSSRGQKRLHQ